MDQNWTPVIFKKTTTVQKNTNINKSKDIDSNDENVVPKVISLSNSLLIQKARINAKLSQKDLANKINVDASIIRNYESGKTNPNYAILCKLERILKIKLNKKKLN